MKDQSIDGILRKAINGSGLPLLQVSKKTGVGYPSLYRFARMGGGITTVTADKLMRFFGLKVVEK